MTGELREPFGNSGARAATATTKTLEGRDPFFRRRMENLIESVFGLDPGEAHAAARLREDFGVDFLDLLELVLAMEAELGVKIPDRALEGAITVDDLVRLAGEELVSAPAKLELRARPRGRPFPPRLRRARRTS